MNRAQWDSNQKRNIPGKGLQIWDPAEGKPYEGTKI